MTEVTRPESYLGLVSRDFMQKYHPRRVNMCRFARLYAFSKKEVLKGMRVPHTYLSSEMNTYPKQYYIGGTVKTAIMNELHREIMALFL